MRRPARAAAPATALLLALVLAACGADRQPVDPLPEPRDGRSGLYLTGRFDGRQVAVSDGLPRLLGDCEARFGMAAEVCFSSRTVDGDPFVVGLGNPGAIARAGRLDAARHGCASTAACREVDAAAVVDVLVGGQQRRAGAGTVSIDTHEPGQRYAGELRLRVGGGRLTGTFDVVPRPDEDGQ